MVIVTVDAQRRIYLPKELAFVAKIAIIIPRETPTSSYPYPSR